MTATDAADATVIDALAREGWARVPGILPPDTAAALAAALDPLLADGAGGARNLLPDAPAARAVAVSEVVRRLAEPVLGAGCGAVRALLFDKTPGANWKVVWHQDLSVALRERRDAPGWGPWSVKAGVVHAQPPATVLEGMLAVRLHLDPCGPENGPLRVLPGTHRSGRLGPDDIAQLRGEIPEIVCVCGVGDALLMRPLLLHASSAAQHPARRRVLHIEYAAADPLPVDLAWNEWHGRGGYAADEGKER